MKAAAVAFGIAAVFLAAVLMGLGQRQAAQEGVPSSIEVKQSDPAVSSSPTPRPTYPEKVERSVGKRELEDYYDDHRGRGRGRGGDDDNSGHGSSNSGSGSSNSGPGSSDD